MMMMMMMMRRIIIIYLEAIFDRSVDHREFALICSFMRNLVDAPGPETRRCLWTCPTNQLLANLLEDEEEEAWVLKKPGS